MKAIAGNSNLLSKIWPGKATNVLFFFLSEIARKFPLWELIAPDHISGKVNLLYRSSLELVAQDNGGDINT